MKSITRVGQLRSVFKGGESELLNGIARLTILYEDLRFEMRELHRVDTIASQHGLPDTDNRVTYFLRRGLATLVEFGRGLSIVRATDEFKNASLSRMDAKYIAQADVFIQQQWTRIKELRNEFAGHVQSRAVDFAVKHLTNETGAVTWNSTPAEWALGIECDFAAVLLAGVISSRCQRGNDALEEFKKAVEIIGEGFVHAQAGMVALVHAFLWDRFGS